MSILIPIIVPLGKSPVTNPDSIPSVHADHSTPHREFFNFIKAQYDESGLLRDVITIETPLYRMFVAAVPEMCIEPMSKSAVYMVTEGTVKIDLVDEVIVYELARVDLVHFPEGEKRFSNGYKAV